MPIEISWYVPKRVLRLHVQGAAGIPQLEQLSKDGQVFLADGQKPIHILLEDTHADPPPLNVKRFKQALDFKEEYTAQLGWIVGVGKTNQIANFVIPLVMKVLKLKFIRVATRDEAIAFLMKQDMSLQPSYPEK